MRAAISARLGHERWLLPGTAARIRETPAGPRIACVTDDGGAYALQARRAVCAMPLFVAQRLLPDIRAYSLRPAVHASPRAAWMVSNFVMDGYPLEAPGEPLSWDNVVYQGQGLGYVVSTHQLLRVARSPRSVFTAYHALSRLEPADARRWLSQASPEALRDEAAVDLIAAYGEEFWRCARRLDITVRGHAMATPHCGSLSNAGLAALRTSTARSCSPTPTCRAIRCSRKRPGGGNGGGSRPGRAPRSRLTKKNPPPALCRPAAGWTPQRRSSSPAATRRPTVSRRARARTWPAGPARPCRGARRRTRPAPPAPGAA